ncbi:transmembrane protein, putative [Medicago truncatula]|uniref:Transmembrane protein, putative n=1 Tax=Medicago truncatula TaxID=3880 RepID=A0A072U5M0_MEDTR|nr:transmembrane protein, putative [Medicago truncatula]
MGDNFVADGKFYIIYHSNKFLWCLNVVICNSGLCCLNILLSPHVMILLSCLLCGRSFGVNLGVQMKLEVVNSSS